MKFLNKLLFVIVTGFTCIISCNRDFEASHIIEPKNVKPENEFVWKALNSWYYWQEKVPNLADNFKGSPQYVNFLASKNPSDLFNALLYTQDIDRFSWIIPNIYQNYRSTGLDYSVYPKGRKQNDYIGIVNYVVPDSPAAHAGIKRGDVITKVNGNMLSLSNSKELAGEHVKLSIARRVSVSQDAVVTSEETDYSLSGIDLQENPVAFHKSLNFGGKKIGYLVYNSFEEDYHQALNNAFGDLKREGVTDLILDLRYNGGGSIETAVRLGQMVTGQFTGSPYVSIEFNKKHQDYNTTERFKDTIRMYYPYKDRIIDKGNAKINSLGLNQVYILTSGGTASASELTIQSLKAYIKVVTIGNETYGKFFGSHTLFDSPNTDYLSKNDRNQSHNWALQPITFAYYNSKHWQNPIKGGLKVDYEINPADYFGRLKEFGELSDPALAKAVELITGQKYTMENRKAIASRRDNTNYSAFKITKFGGSRKTFMPLGTEVYTYPRLNKKS
ncbi:PDZ domain-containing protein [Elizabethkingia argentiflava]|uniref:PDZ domain-containing protein n=1 Tax=Elizabethkingia argenteiflava TaxID=2681556 RepID=A0A845PXI5_9FLAO|nr:S41 family peptidase [Elizabethkingia argenteiflava]NAW51651.1 PDZ domain-containing protein [Elizabethkingia argenteiflava]